MRVPCPGKGFRGARQWPCGSRERVDTACCGVGALRASGSCPAGQPRCSQASSSAHHNLSSHTQSGRVAGIREVRKLTAKYKGEKKDYYMYWKYLTKMAYTNLQAMCQVAVRIREVWLEFQGCAVRCNGLWDVSRILMVKGNIRIQIKMHEGT